MRDASGNANGYGPRDGSTAVGAGHQPALRRSHRARRGRPRRPRRSRRGTARAQRCRQDHPDADPLRGPDPRRRHADVARPRRDRRGSSGLGVHAPGAGAVPRHAGARSAGLDGAPPRARPGRRPPTRDRAARAARPRRTRARQDRVAVGRHGPTRATGCGDGARAGAAGARRAVRRARPRRGAVPHRGDHRAHPRRGQPALLEPPARPRRGPVRDDHPARPRSHRAARRPPDAEGPESEPMAARRRRGRPVVDRRRAVHDRIGRRPRHASAARPAHRPRRGPRRHPPPCRASTTSASRRPASPSCSSRRPARRPRDLAAGDAPRRRARGAGGVPTPIAVDRAGGPVRRIERRDDRSRARGRRPHALRRRRRHRWLDHRGGSRSSPICAPAPTHSVWRWTFAPSPIAGAPACWCRTGTSTSRCSGTPRRS